MVVVMLFLVASIAMMLNYDSANNANTTTGELEAARADYVAEAAMQNALWRSANNSCSSDFTIPATNFGSDSYSAAVTGAAAATNYTLNADQDAWIRSDNVTNNNNTASHHIKFGGGTIEQALYRFDLSSLSAGAQINSATAWFYLKNGQTHPEGPITVHRVTTDWTETGVTWGTLNGGFGTSVLGTISTQAQGGVWVQINLTGQTQAWVNGQPNYGILFNSTAEGIHTEYVSREGSAGQQPYLEVVVGSGPSTPVNVQATGTLADGVTRTIARDAEVAYQPATELMLPFDTIGKDAWVDSTQTTDNFGVTGEMTISGGANPKHFLAQFDVERVPARSRIVSARLELYLNYMGSADPAGAFSLYRMSESWVEGTGDNWNPGDGANWATADGSNAWSWTDNHDSSSPVTTTSVDPSFTGWHSWEIAPLVQQWVSGDMPNYGLLITGNANATNAWFRSSDWGDTTQRPRLIIEYACACGSACQAPQGKGKIALFVDNFLSPGKHDSDKKELLESWGYNVDFWDDDTSTFLIGLLLHGYDAIYVSQSVDSNKVGTKLTGQSIGIVNEEGELNDEFGIASGHVSPVGRETNFLDAGHYITAVFPIGLIDIFDADMEGMTTSGGDAPGALRLAEWGGGGAVVSLEAGAQSAGGGNSAGRRVTVPFGETNKINLDYINANGRLLMQRAVAWAMNADAMGPIGNLLFVVVNPSKLTSEEQAKQTLIESWGYTVNLIDESDSPGAFDTELAANDVVFVSEDANANNVGTKLSNATIGVVTEEDNLSDELGLSAGIAWESGTAIEINNNTHHITAPFALGPLTVFSSSESFAYATGAQAPNLQKLASSSSGFGVLTLEAGETSHTGGGVPGRRAMLPWGGNDMDVAHLTADGLTIFERALEWGMTVGTGNEPIAHWKLDETSGTTAVDSVGGYDGTVINGPPAWVPGKLDGGLSFDGGNDYIDVSSMNPMSYDDFTVLAWYKSADSSVSDDEYIFEHNENFTNEVTFGPTDDGTDDRLRFGFAYGGSGTWDPHYGTSDIVDQQWHHVVGVRSAGRIKIYVDGALESDGADAHAGSTVIINGDGPFIGDLPGNTEQVHGVLDDVRLYDRALTDAEISDLFTATSGGGCDVDTAGIYIEAENYSGTIDGVNAFFTVESSTAGFNGSGYLRNNGGDNFQPPRTEGRTYELNFTETGTYKLWIRGYMIDGFSDSDFLGFDGTEFGQYTTPGIYNQWLWSDSVRTGGTNQLTVVTAGVHTITVWIRERDMLLDGIYITKGSETPSGGIPSGATIVDPSSCGGGGGGGGGGLYVEAYQEWSASQADQWQVQDLSSFGVPANATVEVAITNVWSNFEQWAGTRAVGSTLDRRLRLHEAEAGGTDALVMHVQTDSNSHIEIYADTTDLVFSVLGYWTSGTYVERFNTFTAGANSSWRDRDLAPFGVGSGQVAEIVMANTSTSNEREAGVRTPGSSLIRRVDIHEAESGGVDAATMIVVADSSAGATIQVAAESNADIDFYLVGHWSTPPGSFTEAAAPAFNPSAPSGAWTIGSLASNGVPAGSVVQMAVMNGSTNAETVLGVREVGSTAQRRLALQEAESGGRDIVIFHVNTDSSSSIQWYDENAGSTHEFKILGWWE